MVSAGIDFVQAVVLSNVTSRITSPVARISKMLYLLSSTWMKEGASGAMDFERGDSGIGTIVLVRQDTKNTRWKNRHLSWEAVGAGIKVLKTGGCLLEINRTICSIISFKTSLKK